MTAKARSLANRAGHRLAQAEHVVDALVVILSVIAFGVGLSMLWVPQAYAASNAFRVAIDFAPAQVWGGFLVALGGMTVVALRGDRLTLAATIGGQVIVWALWGICLIAAAWTGRGVPSGAIVYTGLTWACFILATYYWQTRDRSVRRAP